MSRRLAHAARRWDYMYTATGAVLEENIWVFERGKTKSWRPFLVVALKTQAYRINHSNPRKNAPCITVCWFYYCILLLYEKIWGRARLRFEGGQLSPPFLNVKPCLDSQKFYLETLNIALKDGFFSIIHPQITIAGFPRGMAQSLH